jgi:hypothetical protein
VRHLHEEASLSGTMAPGQADGPVVGPVRPPAGQLGMPSLGSKGADDRGRPLCTGPRCVVRSFVRSCCSTAEPTGTATRPVGSSRCSTSSAYQSVSCTSDTFCMAVPGGEVWNGVSWSTSSMSYDAGNAIDCLSNTDCTAVGSTIAHWDGTTWSIEPNPGGYILSSVSCTSDSACVAVGHYNPDPHYDVVRILTWDGSAWSVTSSPSNPHGSDRYGVSCTSGGCTAVGYYSTGTGPGQPMILENDGSSSTWSADTPAVVPYAQNQLDGVSCVDSTDCVAVGFNNPGATTQTLVDSTIGSQPPTQTPEVALVILLPFTAATLFGVFVLAKRRRTA